MSVRAAALVAGLVAAAWVASHDPSVAPPPSVYPGYRLTDTAAVQLIEPVLHAPWIGTVAWIFAALLALCLASEAWLLATACGAPAVAASAVVIALVVSTPWMDTVRHGGPLALALAFAWLAWMCILTPRFTSAEHRHAVAIHPQSRTGAGFEGTRRRWRDRTERAPSVGADDWHQLRWHCAGITAWTIAIASSWLAIILAPLVFAGLTVGDTTRRRVRLGLVMVAIAAGLAGIGLYCWRVGDLATSLVASGAPLGPVDVLATLFDRTTRREDVPSGALGPAGVLAAAFAALGIVGAAMRKRWRVGAVIAGASAAVIALAWPLWAQPVVVLGLWLSLPFVAVGLTVAARAVPPRWRMMATAVGGVMLCIASASETFDARDLPAHDALEPVLASLALDAAALVVEDLDVDAAVIASFGGRTGWRLSRDPAHVAELAERGRTVLAGPVARRQLELAGFRFQRLTADDGTRAFGVSRLGGQLHCAVVRADRWSLLPGVEYTGRLGVEIPAGLGGAMTLIVGDDERPRLVVTGADGEELRPTLEPLLAPPSIDTPPPDYWFDGGDPARAPSHAVRVSLASHPTAPVLRDVALGRRAPRVLARLMRFDAGARGRVCAAPLAAPELWAEPDGPREVVVPLTMSTVLTSGWHGVEGQTADGMHRWTDRVAIALVPSARRAPVRVAIDAEAAASGARPMLRLTVNGAEQPPHEMRAGRSRYEWSIPAPTWLAGTNELMFSLSHILHPADAGGQDVRTLGMKVFRLALTREHGRAES